MGSSLLTPIKTTTTVLCLIPLIYLFLSLDVVTQSLSAGRFLELSYRARQRTQQPSRHRLSLDREDELLYHVNDVPYFSPLAALVATLPMTLQSEQDALSSSLVTILHVPSTNSTISLHDVVTSIESALTLDDVLSPAWLDTLILVANAIDTPIRLDAAVASALYLDYGVKSLLLHPSLHPPPSRRFPGVDLEIQSLPPSAIIPKRVNGPYLARKNMNKMDLYPVYRLYSDIYRTFLFGMYKPPSLSAEEEPYRTFRHVDSKGYTMIPVPSRLYGRSSDQLHGKRIGIKDIFDVKGVVTAGGNRAYGDLYGEANVTASAASKLEDLGAVLVGKTKTATFAMGSQGNSDTVDEQYPFSARGDLWQSCVGSSSGSGCAMGAYDWLDFALGSDTGGSVRGPAAVVGLYGNRPSTGTMPLDGAIPLFGHADTAGIFSRDPIDFTNLLRAWYETSPLELKAYPALPKKLLLSSKYLQQESVMAQGLVDDFIEKISSALGMAKVELDMEAALDNESFGPEDIEGMYQDYHLAAAWWAWTQHGQKFRNDYAAQNQGREPPMDPWARETWENGRVNGSWEQFNRTSEWLVEMGKWINDDTLGQNEDTCSDGIMIYDIGEGMGPVYREKDLNPNWETRNPFRFFPGAGVCPLAGCVDLTIPIGQVPYLSAVSKVEEMKPVTINLVARKGCDFMLLDFVDRLAEAGLITAVKTGRTAY